MQDKTDELIQAELELAGCDPEAVRLMEKHRITRLQDVQPMEFLLRLFGKPVLPRKEVVAFTGKAKSGKTFVLSVVMACCARQEVLAFSRPDIRPLRVLWIDTEQSECSTQEILRDRIVPLVGMEQFPDGLFDIFNLRMLSWQDRQRLTKAAIGWYRPDLVIIDGIADLVADINDAVESKQAVENLMRLASINNCCVACVIHENKSMLDRTIRGWLGTEVTNKAFEVYTCEKDVNRTFSLSQKLTRKYDIAEKLYFTVDEQGLPQQAGAPAVRRGKGRKQKPKANDNGHQKDIGFSEE
mgnify:CR=1 FL=1